MKRQIIASIQRKNFPNAPMAIDVQSKVSEPVVTWEPELTVESDNDQVIAAALRGLADVLDPPKPVY